MNVSASGALARRPSQAVRTEAPRLPAARQALRTSSGTSKGAADQPRASRAPAISSSPKGAPWVDAVPALVGAPNPMVVLHAIMEGLSLTFAASIAAATAA